MKIDRLHSQGRWAPILTVTDGQQRLCIPIESGFLSFSVEIELTEAALTRFRSSEAFYWLFYAKVWAPSQAAGSARAGEVVEGILEKMLTQSDGDLQAGLTEEEIYLEGLLRRR